MIKYHPKKVEILVAMAQKGFNQSSLSYETGLNKSTLSLFFNRKRKIAAPTAKKIAEALDKELNEIFEIEVEGQEVQPK